MEITIIPVTDTPGKFIIYRPRIGLAFIGNRAMADLARRFADETVDGISEEVSAFLEAVGFFLPDPPEPPDPPADFHPTTAVLLMTNQCQLRCTYCYAAAGEAPRQELTFELGRAAIDYVCQSAIDQGRSQFEVSFHGGGEPTFNWKVLVACAEYARQKPIKAHLTLTSNGVWSPRQRDWIIHNLDGLSLSLDGSPATQDGQRPLVTGKGSSAFVLRSAAELDRHHFPYGIRMTATAPWERFPADVRYLCEHTDCHSIQVEPAFNTQRGGHGVIIDEEGAAFIRAYLEAFDTANQLGRRLSYSGARLGTVASTFCTAPYNALIVSGAGTLVTCYEVASSAHELAALSTIGSVTAEGAIAVDTAARSHLHQLMAERRAACRDCFCYWSCAGDCYARAFTNAPDGHQRRDQRCQMNQRLTEQLMLRRIADSGGVWRTSFPIPAPVEGMNPEVVS